MPRLGRLACALAVASLAARDSGDGIPRGVEIYQVAVEDAPLFRPDGERWDGGLIPSGPDVYVLLFDRDGTLLLNTDDEEFNRDPQGDGIGNYTDVGGPDFPLVWDLDPRFTLLGLDRAFVIEIKDDDPATLDDVMDLTDLFMFDDGRARVGKDTDGVVRSRSGASQVRVPYRLVD